MNSFNQTNLAHIKSIFEAKAGVALESSTSSRARFRTAFILAAVLGCLTISAVASQGLFSDLDGDELSMNGTYEGNGIISVVVENRSDRDLEFQPTLKLTRWTTSEKVQPVSDRVIFENTDIPAHSTETMTIDLSNAYDMAALEVPLTDDCYYLTLTNHNFMFGQDWMCSVNFSEPNRTPIEYPAMPEPDVSITQNIQESLRPYFEHDSMDTQARCAGEANYIQNYTRLLEDFEGEIVSSVSPVLPGNRISLEKPYLTISIPEKGVTFDETVPTEEQHLLVGQNWFARDAYFKLVAQEGEYALVLSATVPSARYDDAGTSVPLLYILTYEKNAVAEDAYAFIYGRLFSFTELEPYKVYEDEAYVCYEVSGLMYSDFMTYAEDYIQFVDNLRWDAQSQQRLKTIYTYCKENMSNLFVYRGA